MNPRRRRINFTIVEGFIRTISPIRALSKSTAPEEDRIPVKIWPAKPPRLALVPVAASPPQFTRTVTRNIIQDQITWGMMLAVPMVVGERRRLQEVYVIKNLDKLEVGTPITEYSAGPILVVQGGHTREYRYEK